MTCLDDAGRWTKPPAERHAIESLDGSEWKSRKLALLRGLERITYKENYNWELWIYTTETDDEIRDQKSRWTSFVTICEQDLPRWARANWEKSDGTEVDEDWKAIHEHLSGIPHRFIVGSEKELQKDCLPGNSYRRWFWEEFSKMKSAQVS